MLYDRLKKGRAERELRNCINGREEIPKAFLEELNKPKPDLSNATKTIIKPKPNKKKVTKGSETKSKSKEVKEEQNNNPDVQSFSVTSDKQNKSEDSNENFNNERRDEIPLLIIDVNIRPGVKKKINVYDGDTAESLASKFATEHSKFIII